MHNPDVISSFQHEDRILLQDSVEKFIHDHYAFEERDARLEQFGPYGGNWARFAELGWLGLPFAEDAGGLGGAVLDVQVLMHAFGRGLIAEPYMEVALIAGKVLEYATPPERLEELLFPVIAGTSLVVLAHGENETDCSFNPVSCEARVKSGGYRLNGVKNVVPRAGLADQYIVTALLDDAPALFLVPRGAENLTLAEYTTIDSRMAGDLYLNGVNLPANAFIASGDVARDALRDALLFAFSALIAEAQGIAEALNFRHVSP